MRKFRNIVMMFALILAVSLLGCDGAKAPGNAVSTPPTTNTSPSPANTVDKVNIQTTAQLDAATIQGMNDSLTQLFSEARARGYTKYLNHSDYTVIVRTDCKPAPESGTMSWQEYVAPYGVIWQAEQVKITNNKVQSFQICKDVPQTMFNTTRYGAEHIILYFNDMNEFNRTAVHSTPELAHPIIR